MRWNIAVIPSDGIGKRVIPAAVSILDRLQLGLTFEVFDAERGGPVLPDGDQLSPVDRCDLSAREVADSVGERLAIA